MSEIRSRWRAGTVELELSKIRFTGILVSAPLLAVLYIAPATRTKTTNTLTFAEYLAAHNDGSKEQQPDVERYL
jgi:hypothetical protein